MSWTFYMDIHFWITGFIYPIINLFLTGVSLFGVFPTRYSKEFLLITAAAIVVAVDSGIWLLLKLQKRFDFYLIQNEHLRAI